MLNLPFAARRLYDTSGKEHHNLSSLARDQLAYVSCGEAWSDPTLSKAEQQRRYLLNNLASDVKQIQQFVALREPQSMFFERKILLENQQKLHYLQNIYMYVLPTTSCIYKHYT